VRPAQACVRKSMTGRLVAYGGVAAAAFVGYVYFSIRRFSKAIPSMTEDEVNAAVGLESGPLRTLPLEDIDGLMAALAAGELIKVDCNKWAAEQRKTINPEILKKCTIPCRSHYITRAHPFAVPLKQSLDSPFGEVLRDNVGVQAKRAPWWGLMGADSRWGWLGLTLLKLRSWHTMTFGNGNELLKTYGNLNLQDLAMRDQCTVVELPFAKHWGRVHSYLWVGSAPGMMHYDEMDNILIQVTGHKDILVVPAAYTDELNIGNNADVSKEDSRVPYFDLATKPLSQAIIARHPVLRKHGRLVKLGPGDGILIPSGAFHLPSGKSDDCISLNSFLHGENDSYPEPSTTTAKHPTGFRKFMAAIYTLNCKVMFGNYIIYGRAGKEALESKPTEAGEIAAIAFGPPPPQKS